MASLTFRTAFVASSLCFLLTACAPAAPREVTLQQGKSANIGMGMDLVMNKADAGTVSGEVRCSGKSEPFNLKVNEEFTTECGRTVVLNKLDSDQANFTVK